MGSPHAGKLAIQLFPEEFFRMGLHVRNIALMQINGEYKIVFELTNKLKR
jgi:hypothetical protein